MTCLSENSGARVRPRLYQSDILGGISVLWPLRRHVRNKFVYHSETLGVAETQHIASKMTPAITLEITTT